MTSFHAKQTDDVEHMPVGFQLKEDITSGRYVDENGEPITKARADELLAEHGAGMKTITMRVQYRLPNDPLNRFRVRDVVVYVVGTLTSDKLARIIAAATRTLYGRNPEVLSGRHNVDDFRPTERKRRQNRKRPGRD